MILADTGDSEARYRLLETTRAHAMENLVESGEVDVIRRRHAQHFRERFDYWRDNRSRLTEAPWRAVHVPELDNVRAALDWSLGAGGDPAVGVALAGASRQDLDAALAGFREAAGLMRQSRFIKKDKLGVCLTNLAGVLTERGELGEALAAAREGLPLRRELDATSALDHLALRTALARDVANAVRIAGYTDFVFAAKQSRRQPNETRSRNRLSELMAEKLAPDELGQLLAEGATMSEDDAIRLALEE